MKECICSEDIRGGHTYNKKGDYDKGLPNFCYCSYCDGIIYLIRRTSYGKN